MNCPAEDFVILNYSIENCWQKEFEICLGLRKISTGYNIIKNVNVSCKKAEDTDTFE